MMKMRWMMTDEEEKSYFEDMENQDDIVEDKMMMTL